MRVAKKLFYGLMFLCMLLCGVVLVCAMVPGLTDSIAGKLYDRQPETQGGEAGSQDTPIYPEYTITGSTTAGINWENMPFQNQSGYVIPGEDQLLVPSELAEKNGYRGIEAQTSVIEDPEGEELREQLGIGELGSGLQFQEIYYPYYAMLTEQMQQLYRQIYANARNLNSLFQPVVEVSSDQLRTVFEAVTGDHPELFWMETGYSCKCLQTGKVVEITLKYNDLQNRIDSSRREFEQAAEAILQGARALDSDLERERYVHDALAERASYRIGAEKSQSAYSALVGGETVCAGYARAFQYLMLQLGIPCYYCTGYSGEDHAWNIIYVDGLYRNVDVTWDDGEEISYEYYNGSDKAFAGTHMRKNLSVYLPACPEEGAGDQASVMDGIQGLINPNPIKPLTLADRGEIFPDETKESGGAEGGLDEAGLREAGIKASDVLLDLESYYRDCEKKLIQSGTGQIQFSNCIPVSLWNSIEDAYTGGGYLPGYVENALKSLKAENFAINLQAVRLGGGYYRLYHTIATW